MPMEADPFVRRLIDAYNKGFLDEFDPLVSDDVVLIREGEKAHGREEFKAVLAKLQRAFPDIQYRIDDVIVAGNRIALRWEASGTHRGEYLGVPATGRTVTYTGITMYERGDDGKIARVWVAADLLSLLRRLHEERTGATPEATV
jgi:steroid delta-isomerase-like uncharacterized protein